MKKLSTLFLGLLIITCFAGVAFGEESPYLANIWDNRVLLKAEKRFDMIAQAGNKEQLVQIIGALKIQLGILTDAKSQYILFELARLAEEYLPTAIQVAAEGPQIKIDTTKRDTSTGTIQVLPEETIEKTILSGTENTTFVEVGKASYYASSFEGDNTTNGDIFTNNEFTAAHKTLPFNTRVKVINKKNNHRVIVRINDRGPFTPGRIIDLSQGAFKAINNDSLRAGILDVTIEKVE